MPQQTNASSGRGYSSPRSAPVAPPCTVECGLIYLACVFQRFYTGKVRAHDSRGSAYTVYDSGVSPG